MLYTCSIRRACMATSAFALLEKPRCQAHAYLCCTVVLTFLTRCIPYTGDNIQPSELTFSRIVHRDETQRQQLASTAYKGVYLVHCRELSPGSSHKASDSHVTAAVYPETAGGVSGFMEHARLYGCLE